MFSLKLHASGDNARNLRSFRKARSNRITALAILPGLLLVSGCGETQVPVYPVTGKVTFKGRPPAGAQVVLQPVNATEQNDVSPTGIVSGDGSFSITSYQPGDGAPEGDYVATVEWFKIVSEGGGGGRGPNVLPKKYASPKDSPVKVSVAGAPVQIPTIDIK